MLQDRIYKSLHAQSNTGTTDLKILFFYLKSIKNERFSTESCSVLSQFLLLKTFVHVE